MRLAFCAFAAGVICGALAGAWFGPTVWWDEIELSRRMYHICSERQSSLSLDLKHRDARRVVARAAQIEF